MLHKVPLYFSGHGPNAISAECNFSLNISCEEKSLRWAGSLVKDCQRGMQAYLKTADTNPDAALVGTGWVDPTNGHLINGQSNNCMSGSLSMDNVVQLVHSKGGMAYLTVTMETDGAPQAWTSQQQSDYIAKASTNQSFIDPIIQEVKRANYDGVIMDMEAGDPNYPNIQQLFTTFNQRVWSALKPLHKLYGIALIHKLSDHDEYYYLNGFENWSTLAHAADFMVIMAVDQSYFSPGPTVSVPWLQQLLAYDTENDASNADHILSGSYPYMALPGVWRTGIGSLILALTTLMERRSSHRYPSQKSIPRRAT